jgi:hypothetical protein
MPMTQFSAASYLKAAKNTGIVNLIVAVYSVFFGKYFKYWDLVTYACPEFFIYFTTAVSNLLSVLCVNSK